MLAIYLFVASLGLAATNSINFNSNLGKSEFTAIGKPAMLKIHGEGPGPAGTLQIVDGKVYGTLKVDLRGLTTGIALRDDHMKNKYLDVGKYPEAQIEITGIPMPLNGSDETQVTTSAKLELHGQVHEVPVVATVQTKSGQLEVHARLDLKISDFGIEVPSYMGIKIADHVEVNATTRSTR